MSVGVATLGIDLHKIELLTNHVPKGVTARHYLRTSRLEYLHPEVQRIGDWIEQQGQIAEAKVDSKTCPASRVTKPVYLSGSE